MIRQLTNRGESENRPQKDPHEIAPEPAEMLDSPEQIFDEDEDIDPADFFDPEDLGVQTRR
jgi:hypothetical protein